MRKSERRQARLRSLLAVSAALLIVAPLGAAAQQPKATAKKPNILVTTWEGGFRIPMMVRWPGVIQPGTVYNDVISLIDWMPTLAAAAGVPDLKERMASDKGFAASAGKTFKVHLDGNNFLPYFQGKEKPARATRSTTSTRAAT